MKSYVKVEDNIYHLLNKEGIGQTSRLVYFALSGSLLPNSAFAKATYKQIRFKSGIASDETVKKALDELASKGFISKMDTSLYRLWHGVFKGLKEQELDPSDIYKSTTLTVEHSTTLTVEPHVRDINLNLTKELQHKDDDFQFIKTKKENPPNEVFVFSEKSPFQSVSQTTLPDLILKHGFNAVQEKITKLEYTYPTMDKIRASATGLLCDSLRYDWEIENKKETVIKKNKERSEEHEAQEKQYQEQEKNRHDDESKKHRALIDRIKSSHPQLYRKSVEFVFSKHKTNGKSENHPLVKGLIECNMIQLFKAVS